MSNKVEQVGVKDTMLPSIGPVADLSKQTASSSSSGLRNLTQGEASLVTGLSSQPRKASSSMNHVLDAYMLPMGFRLESTPLTS
jgi:hypothetical protein